jgi:hypothetical protein
MRMCDLLDDVRDAMGDRPRDLGYFTLSRLRVDMPDWMRDDEDDLLEVFDFFEDLLIDGDIVWGALVQANGLLFEPGREDHPAVVIYAANGSFDDQPHRLLAIARRMFRLKNTTPADPELRRIGDLLANETARGLGTVVPRSLTDGKKIRCASFMVFRSHLPGDYAYLQGSWFPLLIHPDTDAVLMVPGRYWPRKLVLLWEHGKLNIPL